MRWMMLPLAFSVAAVLAAVAFLLATVHRESPRAPDYRVVRIGGLAYESMLGRPLDPARPVDARILAGLPARERHLPHGDILFGAFISVTNDSSGPLETARRIDLRDDAGHVYRPLALPTGNAYAYSPRRLHPTIRIPARRTPAADDLAATGRLLLYRIPGWQYRNGVLELRIHGPAETASLIV